MLSVEIIKPPNSASWLDHEGNSIDKLIFTKEYLPSYYHGIYPLESYGSLYRNIDDFRESPFQSRTDWEISVPSVYSTSDGSFSTVDLLYHLEGVNAAHGIDFDLIGCEAVLYDDFEIVYSGVVESVSVSGRLSRLRISDWLGAPKIGTFSFPIGLGTANILPWPVKITNTLGGADIEISDVSLKAPPTFYIKSGSGEYLRVSAFINFYGRLSDSEEETPSYFGPGFMKLSLYQLGETVNPIPQSIPNTPMPYDRNDLFLEFYRNDMPEVLRPDLTADKPDYFLLSYNNAVMGTFEVWTRRSYGGDGYDNDDSYLPVGRPPLEDRTQLPDVKYYFIRRQSSSDIWVRTAVKVCAESMVMNAGGLYSQPPFQSGNPSQLVLSSQNENASGCLRVLDHPTIRAFYAQRKFNSKEMDIHGSTFTFQINLSSPGISGDAKLSSASQKVYLALNYNGVKDKIEYTASFRIGSDSTPINLPSSMDGTIKEYKPYLNGKQLSDVLTLTFTFEISAVKNAKITSEDCLAVRNISVLYARAEYAVNVKVDEGKLYARGELADSFSPDSIVQGENTSVKAAAGNLLNLAKTSGAVAGDSNALPYGTVVKGEASALRDRLRSLAAESATLLRLDRAERKIIAKDISLQSEPDSYPIPLSALVHEGIYSFSMETPDRSDLLSGIAINWGKDTESGKYAHTYSVSASGYIAKDGKRSGASFIEPDKWAKVFSRMSQNVNKGIGIIKTIDSEWIASWDAAENMAYNLLRWNSAPMRKAQVRCIFTELGKIKDKDGKPVDIGTFVSLPLPGYHPKFLETAWIVTGRHDDLDSMVTTLELLEARDLPASPPGLFLLLEDGGNMLLENNDKIKLEDVYG